MTYTPGSIFSAGERRHKLAGGNSAVSPSLNMKESHIRNFFRRPHGGMSEAQTKSIVVHPAQGTYRIRALLDDGTILDTEHTAPSNLHLEDICACFARGTLISTSAGQVAIEDLHPGDAIRTRDNGTQILRWIGSCPFPTDTAAQPGEAQAIRIKSNALGEMRPIEDLIVSSRFRLLTNHPGCAALFGSAETLAPAVDLLDGDTILAVRPSPDLEFFNLMFDRHQIITANGLETESYHPGDFGVAVMSLEMQSHLRRIFAHLNDNLTAFGQSARPILKGFEAEVLRAG